jgi:hypothetical protein
MPGNSTDRPAVYLGKFLECGNTELFTPSGNNVGVLISNKRFERADMELIRATLQQHTGHDVELTIALKTKFCHGRT